MSYSFSPQGDTEIAVSRTFSAPRECVFAALTTPALLRRWVLGPPGWEMPVCELDPRQGGRFRYEWKHSDGSHMGMSGEFLEFNAPEHMLHSEKWDVPFYPGNTRVTTRLTENAGQTTVHLTLHFASKEARDSVLQTGMEKGMALSYDRLEKLLASQIDKLA